MRRWSSGCGSNLHSSLPCPACAASLAPSWLSSTTNRLAVGRRYITPVVLTFNEALPEAEVSRRRQPPEQHQQDDALLHHLTGRDL